MLTDPGQRPTAERAIALGVILAAVSLLLRAYLSAFVRMSLTFVVLSGMTHSTAATPASRSWFGSKSMIKF